MRTPDNQIFAQRFLVETGIIIVAENGDYLLTFKGWLFFFLDSMNVSDKTLKRLFGYNKWWRENRLNSPQRSS